MILNPEKIEKLASHALLAPKGPADLDALIANAKKTAAFLAVMSMMGMKEDPDNSKEVLAVLTAIKSFRDTGVAETESVWEPNETPDGDTLEKALDDMIKRFDELAYIELQAARLLELAESCEAPKPGSTEQLLAELDSQKLENGDIL